MKITAIVTDIEGTTSSIAFVHDILFPYASKMLPDFVRQHKDETEVSSLLDATRQEANEDDADTERVIEILLTWVNQDKKATPLKALQGLVWKQGYMHGDFRGHIYDDATRNLRAWHQRGINLYVYSSGSVQAQQLLFGYSDDGDLRSLFKGYFDTRLGPKRSAASYHAITNQFDIEPERILFLSDIIDELDAARDAGMQTFHLLRDDTTQASAHRVARSFDDILI